LTVVTANARFDVSAANTPAARPSAPYAIVPTPAAIALSSRRRSFSFASLSFITGSSMNSLHTALLAARCNQYHLTPPRALNGLRAGAAP